MEDEVLSTESTTKAETQEVAAEPAKEAAKMYSEEEYNKAIKSSASKAKYEILKEMGVKSVDDFKQKYSEYEGAIKDKESLLSQLDERDVQIKQLRTNLVMEQLHVNEDFKDDLVTLATSKMSDKVDFETACKEVLERNPNWLKAKEPVKMGTEKSEKKPEDTMSKIKEKYPWLKQ